VQAVELRLGNRSLHFTSGSGGERKTPNHRQWPKRDGDGASMLLRGPKPVFKIAQSRGFNERRFGGENRSRLAQSASRRPPPTVMAGMLHRKIGIGD
jgi:hypothetical protein